MNFQGFDVRHLTILDTLFKELHVGRAAQRLNLSQPAISNSLAWLRRHFGDPLLVRGGRTLRLTPFAERLREPVRLLRAPGAADDHAGDDRGVRPAEAADRCGRGGAERLRLGRRVAL